MGQPLMNLKGINKTIPSLQLQQKKVTWMSIIKIKLSQE